MWTNYIPACIRCLQPGLMSLHPEEGESKRGSTKVQSLAGLGAICSEGLLVLRSSVLRPSRAGFPHPGGPWCLCLKWYGCQRDLGVCRVGGMGGGLSGGVEDQWLQQHFI